MRGRWIRAAAGVAVLVAALPAVGCSSPADPRPVAHVGADAAGSPAPPAATPGFWSVAAENRRAGTPGWQLTRVGAPARHRGLGGPHSRCSPASEVGLHVSTTARQLHRARDPGGLVRRRAGPRGMAVGDRLPGVRQPAATVAGATPHGDAPTGRCRCRWTPTGWPPGDYLFRLDASIGCAALRAAAGAPPPAPRERSWWSAPTRPGRPTTPTAGTASTTARTAACGTGPSRSPSTGRTAPRRGQGASEYGQNMQPLVAAGRAARARRRLRQRRRPGSRPGAARRRPGGGADRPRRVLVAAPCARRCCAPATPG